MGCTPKADWGNRAFRGGPPKVVTVALAALLALPLAACATPDRARVPAVGKPAPAYSAVTLDGDSVSLVAQRGKVVLLNIWATWCHPCRDELPVLQRLYEQNAPRGLEIVGVSVDSRGEERKVRDFARSFGLTYPVWHDPDERVSALFLAPGVPASYLIDRTGVLRWRHVGPVRDGDPALRQALEQALEAGRGTRAGGRGSD
jgi:cytochrome c biogenesis protein CcmG/thiol:disulfide interchange protein DsbE